MVSVPTSAQALPNAVALLAFASALPTKPACIRQPAPRSSGSVIDLSPPDAALAPAMSIIDIAGIDTV